MSNEHFYNTGVDLDQQAKADEGKLEISLVPPQIIKDIAEVRMYGNAKYHDPGNWTKVSKERYFDALLRHVLEAMPYSGNPGGIKSVDQESGIMHLKHAACNLAFILQQIEWEKDEENRRSDNQDPKCC